MVLAMVILAAAFSLAIWRASGTCPAWAEAHRHLGVPVALPLGRFPSSFMDVLAAAAGTDDPDVLGASASDGVANMALGILPWPAPHLGVCLVLAIYNTKSCLPENHLSTHYPRQHPNRIHTASSLLALSACHSLGCSISCTTNFQLLRNSADTCAQGDGYLTLTPVVHIAPTLGRYSLALILILTLLE